MFRQPLESGPNRTRCRRFVDHTALAGIVLATIVYVSDNAYVNQSFAPWEWQILPIALFFFALCGIGVQTMLVRHAQKRAMMLHRTAELMAANEELQREIADRKRADEALILEKRFCDAVIDSLPGLFYLLDENGRFVRWNTDLTKMTGYSAEETAGRDALTLIADEDRDRVAQKIVETFRDGSADIEANILLKNGTKVPFCLTGARKVIGEKAYLIGLGIDISNRKRLEESLRASERLHRLFAENVSDLIWVIDFSGRFTFLSPSVEQLLGYTAEEGLQFCIADVLTPASMAIAGQLLEEATKAIRAGQNAGPEKLELEHVRKDGSTVWAEMACSTMRDELGQVVAIQGVTRDVSERRRLEEALRKSERLYRLLAENVSDVIWAIDFSGRYLYLSPSVQLLLGYTAEEGLKLSIDDVLAPSSRTLAHKLMAESLPALKAGEHVGPKSLEIEHVRKDGSTVWADVTVGTMLDESGQVIAIQGVTRDSTEHRRMEAELRSAKEAAEAATRAKSRFLAVMSHEIRTPMTAILGYSDLLVDPQLDPGTRQDYLATIRRSGEHLLLLIDDILDLSKIEAGKLALDMHECNLAEIVTDVANMMRPRAEQRGNTLLVEYATEIPEIIYSDPARLRQAVVNLSGNAVKFTENGTVRLRVSFLPHWRNGDPGVAIEVIDTGIGIREDAIATLFQPFTQADSRVSTKYGGTGLGLAISRQIAELLGGELLATSEFGHGSNFKLTVPTGDVRNVKMPQRPAETSSQPSPKREPSAGKSLLGVRVLLAEDGFDNQRLIATVLRRAGADVRIAENGRIAMAMAEAEPFDVLLMDMNMPEMDGDEATRLLRSRNYQRPILAITAATMTEDIARSLAAGCDDHLPKPIDLAELIATVEWYARKNSADETLSTSREVVCGEVKG